MHYGVQKITRYNRASRGFREDIVFEFSGGFFFIGFSFRFAVMLYDHNIIIILFYRFSKELFDSLKNE